MSLMDTVRKYEVPGLETKILLLTAQMTVSIMFEAVFLNLQVSWEW